MTRIVTSGHDKARTPKTTRQPADHGRDPLVSRPANSAEHARRTAEDQAQTHPDGQHI
jgi:hypothetical protein